MSQHIKKPSLPSIHFLLNDTTTINNTTISTTTTNTIPTSSSPPFVHNKKSHHKQSHSMNSLPSELQQLSLSAPAYNIPERSENNQPSWMIMAPSSIPPQDTNIKRNSHVRSISDLSVINLVSQPQQVMMNKSRHQTHKRSVSANTTLLMNDKSMNNNLPLIDERARTHSPPTLSDALNINNERQHPTLFLNQVEQVDLKSSVPKEYENVMVARDEHTGRYYCPFCNKAFNRPSSLRIHTYSHTGEKPFVCQEEGCGRQFSVQSNMRRHLRVHRFGRTKSHK